MTILLIDQEGEYFQNHRLAKRHFRRITERRLNWFGHVSRMGSERLPAKALHWYINGKRSQGRQPKKWMDNVNEHIEAKKLTVQQAMVLVWDRNKWKHQVAASSSSSLKLW